jgi:Zn-dependent protease with chaperone function
MADGEIALAGPVIALGVGLVLWGAWTAYMTPWSARIPRAPEAATAAWPPITPPQQAALRLARWSRPALMVGRVLVLGGLMTAPGAQLISRTHSVALATVAIGGALLVARVPAYVLSLLAIRRLDPALPQARPRWWVRKLVAVAYLLVVAPGFFLTLAVDNLRRDPAAGWVYIVVLSFFILLAIPLAWMTGGRGLRKATTTDELREIGEALKTLSGVFHVRIVVGVAPGNDFGAGVLAGPTPVVAVHPESVDLRRDELTGLLAHELSHVKHGHAQQRLAQTVMSMVVGALAALVAVSTPALRHAVNAGDMADGRVLVLAFATFVLTWWVLRTATLVSFRRQEALADLDALHWAPPEGVAPLLRQRAGNQLLGPRSTRWELLTSAAHPDPVDRIALPQTAAPRATD